MDGGGDDGGGGGETNVDAGIEGDGIDWPEVNNVGTDLCVCARH